MKIEKEVEKPTIPKFVDKWAKISNEERDCVIKLMDNGYTNLKGNEYQSLFEEEFAASCDEKYCLSFSSGTMAMVSALAALEVSPNSEVILPTYAYHASVTCVKALGAIPVFIDCGIGSLQFSLSSIEESISSRTSCIIIQHTWGNIGDVEGLKRLSQKYQLPVLADCSHSFGASIRGSKSYLHFDVGVYSLGPGKWVSGGELGVIVCNNSDIYDKCFMFSQINRNKKLLKSSINWDAFDNAFYLKCRPHIYSIGLAKGSLLRISEKLTMINSNAQAMETTLRKIPWIKADTILSNVSRVYWRLVVITSLTLEQFQYLSVALKAEGIILLENEYYPLQHQRNINLFPNYYSLLRNDFKENLNIVYDNKLPNIENIIAKLLTFYIHILPEIDYTKFKTNVK